METGVLLRKADDAAIPMKLSNAYSEYQSVNLPATIGEFTMNLDVKRNIAPTQTTDP